MIVHEEKAIPGTYHLKYAWESECSDPQVVIVKEVADEVVTTERGTWDRWQFEEFVRLGVLVFQDDLKNTHPAIGGNKQKN